MNEQEYIKWLEEELHWAYGYIMGDNEDFTTTQAGWRSFNGLKKIRRNDIFKKWSS